MDASFADRLARINAQNEPLAVNPNVDMIGSSGGRDLPELPQMNEPLSYDQRFKRRIANNVLMGGVWMGITGFIAVNFFKVAKFLAGAETTAESYFNIQVGIGVALAVSFVLYFWVAREAVKDLGKLHGMPMSLAVGGGIGLLLGAGPQAAIDAFKEYGHLVL